MINYTFIDLFFTLGPQIFGGTIIKQISGLVERLERVKHRRTRKKEIVESQGVNILLTMFLCGIWMNVIKKNDP